MKTISIRQPWADLIVKSGAKQVENRTWKSLYRGPVYIHAGLKVDMQGYAFAEEMGIADLPSPDKIDKGGIIASAEMTDCVTSHGSGWFTGPFGFVLKDVRSFPLIKLPGKLSFFNVPASLMIWKHDADSFYTAGSREGENISQSRIGYISGFCPICEERFREDGLCPECSKAFGPQFRSDDE